MVEAGVFLAVAQLLSYIKLFEAPFGGSVTAASMLPVLLFAVRWGARWGLGAGLAYGVLQFLLGPQWIPPIANQLLAYASVIFLDYLAAFGVLGLAGLFKRRTWGLLWGSLAGISARFLVHFVSGLILWGSAVEDMPAWLYSLAYNGSYLGPELVICLAAALVLTRPLSRYITGHDIGL